MIKKKVINNPNLLGVGSVPQGVKVVGPKFHIHVRNKFNENHDLAIARSSSSRADSGLRI